MCIVLILRKRLSSLLTVALALALVFALAACGRPATEPTPTAPVDQYPAPAPTIFRVGMEAAYAPYNWTQPDDSNGAWPIYGSPDFAHGYDVMIAKHLAAHAGFELQIVRLDWDSIIPAVQAGHIDAAIAGQSITARRLEVVDFTTPYFYASIVVLVQADGPFADAAGISDLYGAIGTSQINTVWYDVILPQVPGAVIRPPQNSAPEMIVALNAGAVDMVVTDMPTAMAAVIAHPNLVYLDFTYSDDPFHVTDEQTHIGISVRQGNTELLDALNAGLATLTVDDFNRMMQEAIAIQPLAG